MNLNKQRKRAISILEKEARDTEFLPIDFAIDEECRRVLELPPRPPTAPPYSSWMVGERTSSSEATKTSQVGIDMIKRWEGLRTHSYLCPAGVWTIGYGHTRTAAFGQKITEARAEELLKDDLVRFEKGVLNYVKKPINQNQFDALVSFSFNVGVNAFKNSTLLKMLNQGRYQDAALQLHRWVRADGRKLPGLVRRRNDEFALFMS